MSFQQAATRMANKEIKYSDHLVIDEVHSVGHLDRGRIMTRWRHERVAVYVQSQHRGTLVGLTATPCKDPAQFRSLCSFFVPQPVAAGSKLKLAEGITVGGEGQRPEERGQCFNTESLRVNAQELYESLVGLPSMLLTRRETETSPT